MIELLLALFLACSCPTHNCPIHQHGGGPVVTTNTGDTDPGDESGGDTEHIPPGPPKPGGH